MQFQCDIGDGHAVSGNSEHPISRRWLERADKPRLCVLLFRDSFGETVGKYLAEECSRLVSCSEYGIDAALIEAERPDLVLEIYVERKLLVGPPTIEHLPGSDVSFK